MKEKIKCPNCGSKKIKKNISKVGVGATNGTLPEPTEEYINYKCFDCGHEFGEEDLRQE